MTLSTNRFSGGLRRVKTHVSVVMACVLVVVFSNAALAQFQPSDLTGLEV